MMVKTQKHPFLYKANKYFPVGFMIFCALMFAGNQLCVLLGVI